LLFPNFDQTRAVMQEAWIWHASAALAYIALSLGHIYLGTIGLEGSYQAMRSGNVDETWAKEHHEYWYEEAKSGPKEKTWTRKPSTSASANS
jgi:formate dehydrogenase subunit gamma